MCYASGVCGVDVNPMLIQFSADVRWLAEHGVEVVRHGLGHDAAGVGKTTVAAAIALELAQRGHAVLLSTADPVAHVAWTLRELLPGLAVSRIDAELEINRYRDEVLANAGGRTSSMT